ncbi:MAG: hypothetical protein IJ568_01095 [Bacilli bacterium]|nr:hypothetical protein [Bacilli bacterium]
MKNSFEKQELLTLKSVLEKIKKNELSIKLIDEIISKLVPKDKNNKTLVSKVVTDGKMTPAAYIPNYNLIRVSLSGFEQITQESAKVLGENFKSKKIEEITNYYRLFAILHEIEHSKQFLMSKDVIDSPSDELKNGYKNVTNIILKDDSLITTPIKRIKKVVSLYKYNSNPNDYILERNANVEASKKIIDLATINNEEEIKDIFEGFNLAMKFIGYYDDELGCMYKTHEALNLMKLYNKIKKDDTINEEDKLRYGLTINKETRKTLLKRIDESKLSK